jgi:membrane-associated phospholipid phosphatase
MAEARADRADGTSPRWWLATPGWQRWAVLGIWAVVVAAMIAGDEELRRWYRSAVPDLPELRALADTLTQALHPALAFLMVCGACLAAWARWGEVAKAMSAAIAIQAIGIAVLKDIIGRVRPNDMGGISVFRGPEFGSHSMPSGHAGLAFVLAAVLSGFFPRARWVFYPLAAAVALARVHVDRHFFSDAVAGALIGILVGQWAVWRFSRAPEEAVPEPESGAAAPPERQAEPVGPPG